MQGSAAPPSITWEGKGGVGHGDDVGKRKGCLNPWAPSLPPPAARPLERRLRNTTVFGGRNLGEVRAGTGFCKPKSPINPFQALKSVPPPSGTKRLRIWWGRVKRAPRTQINYRGWMRCTRARQTWPKLGWDNAGTSQRTWKVSWGAEVCNPGKSLAWSTAG